jgi:hypothetical protein
MTQQFHRGCGMWNFSCGKVAHLISPSQALWKTVKNSTEACGEKVVAALRENGLFHITFYYYC